MKLLKVFKKKAFSLLELAIVLTIVSVIIGFAVSAYQSQVGSVELKNAEDKLNSIKDSLDNFFKINNRYPCPAAANLAATDVNFGVEAASCAPSACPAGMVCGARSARGSVPFKTLGLPNNFGSDSWGTKISYAIDNLFTQANGNCESGGALTIQDYTNNNISTSAVYALISHGVDKAGGFNAETTAQIACNGAYKDGENCDADDIFRSSDLKTKTAAVNDSYDDVMVWSGNPNFKTCPAGLRDCRVWLDSSDRCTVNINTGGVSEWRSKGALRHRAVQGTTSIRPDYITASGNLINGRPHIRFTSGDFMFIDNTFPGDDPISTISDSQYTQVVVIRTTDTQGVINGITDVPSYFAGANDRYFAMASGGGFFRHFNFDGSSEFLTSTTSYNNNLPHIAVASVGSASTHKLWVDGALIGTGTHVQSTFTWKAAIIFGGFQSVGYFEGDLLEYLYFDYVLSNEERRLLETYLSTKWGVN